ncbi:MULTISPECIES: hypothetical protein [Burkholderia]|uniref:hypothetical protein n=1 Tax=Burkholderia TaxID=32008 RepID=UPI000A40097B|nr:MULTISPECIES: hypothetical protein [Burkholderia]
MFARVISSDAREPRVVRSGKRFLRRAIRSSRDRRFSDAIARRGRHRASHAARTLSTSTPIPAASRRAAALRIETHEKRERASAVTEADANRLRELAAHFPPHRSYTASQARTMRHPTFTQDSSTI